MTTTLTPTTPERAPMSPLRKTALVAGGLYLTTFLAGIPPTFLYGDVLTDPTSIVRSGADTTVLWGGVLEVINAFACIGTAVVLFPVVKRQSEAAALGFVTARVLEAAIIVVGVVSLFTVVTLQQDLAAAAADPASMDTVGSALVTAHDWTALLGPGLLPVVNALLLGSLLYRSGLVPRAIPLMGLVGAPLLLASTMAAVFGLNEQISVLSAIAVIPIFFWELSLGIYLVVKGFKPSPITSTPVHAAVPVA